MISTKTSILIGAALALSACGGKSAPSTDPTPPPDAAPTAPTELTPGTTGFPGLDWGDDRAKVKEAYRSAATRGEDMWAPVVHAGHDAAATFVFTGESLISISVTFAGEYPDMGACADPFHVVEAELIKSLGDSAEENLAAYWTTATASVTLACNPMDDSGRAELTASYTLAEPTE
jgi:hypothetical protein